MSLFPAGDRDARDARGRLLYQKKEVQGEVFSSKRVLEGFGMTKVAHHQDDVT